MPSTIVIHSHLLDGITASACSLPPFLPASDPRLPNARQGKVLSLHHLKGKSFAYMNTQLSKYNNLAAHPPTLRRFRANGSHPLIVDVAGLSELQRKFLSLFPVRIDAILEGFADDHWPFCCSMYCLTTSSDTASTRQQPGLHPGIFLADGVGCVPPIPGPTASRTGTGSGIASISRTV